jgi:hypothetical protein
MPLDDRPFPPKMQAPLDVTTKKLLKITVILTLSGLEVDRTPVEVLAKL